jgi:hypothetical protein
MLALDPRVRIDRRGSCVPTALYCIPFLNQERDVIVEGWVSFPPSTRKHQHTWLIIDGELYDPSLVQFKRMRFFSADRVRRSEKQRMSPAKYFVSFALALDDFWRERLRRFGVDIKHVLSVPATAAHRSELSAMIGEEFATLARAEGRFQAPHYEVGTEMVLPVLWNMLIVKEGLEHGE